MVVLICQVRSIWITKLPLLTSQEQSCIHWSKVSILSNWGSRPLCGGVALPCAHPREHHVAEISVWLRTGERVRVLKSLGALIDRFAGAVGVIPANDTENRIHHEHGVKMDAGSFTCNVS
eukprot:6464153-Amphidinium_carterae.1